MTQSPNAPWQSPLPGVPDVESPFFSKIFDGKGESAWRDTAQQLHDDGFAIIDFPEPEFDRLAEEIIEYLNPRYNWDGYHGAGVRPDMRIQDAWQSSDAVKALATNKVVLDLLEYLYGRPTFPFQTLNFAVGTEQHYHMDSIHFSSFPERFMCGVWVALEDIDEDAGPLYYYPGSHKLPSYSNMHYGLPRGKYHQPVYHRAWKELVDAHGLERKYFKAKKGQALIWAANLLHGGASQNNKDKTRWSQVTHYYFEDCTYYTPLMSHLPYPEAHLREPFDIRSGAQRKNCYMGEMLPQDYFERLTMQKEVPPQMEASKHVKDMPEQAAETVRKKGGFLRKLFG